MFDLVKLSPDLFYFVKLSHSEERESRSRLGLETEGTKTFGIVSVSYKISEHVLSRMENFGTVSSKYTVVF